MWANFFWASLHDRTMNASEMRISSVFLPLIMEATFAQVRSSKLFMSR